MPKNGKIVQIQFLFQAFSNQPFWYKICLQFLKFEMIEQPKVLQFLVLSTTFPKMYVGSKYW